MDHQVEQKKYPRTNTASVIHQKGETYRDEDTRGIEHGEAVMELVVYGGLYVAAVQPITRRRSLQ
ncbi:hypothetical protein N7513_000703 [Penicillium frequentans]|nr:hypothetical protein N7513_000703 [Penicillium glabrum]